MDTADTVVEPRAPQAQAGHVEGAIAVLAAQLENPVEIQPRGFCIRAQGMGNQVPRKNVMAGGNRRMGGKQGAGGNGFQGGLEAEAVFHGHPAALQDLEGGMAFVDVPGGGFDTQCCQRPGAPDAQQDFLADAGV